MGKPEFIGKKSKAAGGWGALRSCGKKLLASGAPLSGAAAMLKANQPDGFDCPGCAWGDPEHGSSFEFCENGVKAVAWEATDKRVKPDFFQAHTVSELRSLDRLRARARRPADASDALRRGERHATSR